MRTWNIAVSHFLERARIFWRVSDFLFPHSVTSSRRSVLFLIVFLFSSVLSRSSHLCQPRSCFSVLHLLLLLHRRRLIRHVFVPSCLVTSSVLSSIYKFFTSLLQPPLPNRCLVSYVHLYGVPFTSCLRLCLINHQSFSPSHLPQ